MCNQGAEGTYGTFTGEYVGQFPMLPLVARFGLAVAPAGGHVVVTCSDDKLSVYSEVSRRCRTHCGYGSGSGRFNRPAKVCFSAAGNILVAEHYNKRVQEVTLTGDHVRFIGAGVIDDKIWGIAANAELIVVGKCWCTSNNRIMMFDAVTGVLVRAFGDYGDTPGQLMKYCYGIRFMPDGRHIIVAESTGYGKGRLSVFTLAGELVRCIGEGKLTSAHDVEFADNGDIIVCDQSFSHSVYVYSADGSTQPRALRPWMSDGKSKGYFRNPCALARADGKLYVLDGGVVGVVHVFKRY